MAQPGEDMDDVNVHVPAADDGVGGSGGAGNGGANGLGWGGADGGGADPTQLLQQHQLQQQQQLLQQQQLQQQQQLLQQQQLQQQAAQGVGGAPPGGPPQDVAQVAIFAQADHLVPVRACSKWVALGLLFPCLCLG